MSKPICFTLLTALIFSALLGCSNSSSGSLYATKTGSGPADPGPVPGPGTVSATLQWDAPTENTAGQPLPPDAIIKYKVYYGKYSHFYTMAEDAGTSTSWVKNLPSGTYYFAVTAYDEQSGNESDFSNEVSKTL